MDFIRKPRQRVERKPEVESLEQSYPHNVMLYRIPPIQDITLQEFEDLALERLKLLRIFEHTNSKSLRFLSDEWKESINAEINLEGLKGYARLFQGVGSTVKETDLQARRRDYISHFILRLAYCRSSDLQRWFCGREMEVFRYKFAALTANQVKEFLEINKLNYTPLSESQKSEVKDGLYESTVGQSVGKVELMDFYKVHFTEVLDLIRGRRCFVQNGYAYVSSSDFVSIVSAKYQAEIERGLLAAQRILPEIENDERLFYLLKSLHTSYTGKDYTLAKNAAVPIESIDQLSKKSFPLCMRACHETLRTSHRHKYGGRLQYGLFLKGIGVTLEDSLRFWRDEYTKIMDLERFEKGYAYNIRHNYGKEGSMVNYSPHSCMKIIMENVGPQETHGCPYKHYDPATLKSKLASCGLSAAHVQEVASLASKGHYQIACAKYFEITHDSKIEQGISHPNQYFDLSQTVMGNREVKSATPAAKSVRKVFKKEPNATLMDEYDDELWNMAETQASQMEDVLLKSSETNAWDEDFDVSQVESMDF